MVTKIFTLGTSNRTEDEFYTALGAHEIRCLIDVRSRPVSRNRQFNQARMRQACEVREIDYLFMGEVLGGLNAPPTTSWPFQSALAEVAVIAERAPSTLICAEGDPAECHRSYKVGVALAAAGFCEVINILRDGSEEQLDKTLARTRPKLLAEFEPRQLGLTS